MTPQSEIERFYWNCAADDVDLLRARLGIPYPVPFRPIARVTASPAQPKRRDVVTKLVAVAVAAFTFVISWRASR